MKTRIAALLTALTMTVSMAAVAESVSFSGTVAASRTVEIYAPIGGTVESVGASVGETVAEGDVLASLKTTKVYATQDGTVTAVFGQPGDSADTVTNRYGGVVVMEGEVVYTISASIENAYSSTTTKTVHVGETVYFVSRTANGRTGSGMITAISGTSYTVEVTKGSFIPGESVDIYRSAAQTTASRVGRGTIARNNPTTISGSGSIIAIHVKAGDTVKRGDLILETLDGSFDGLYMSGTEIEASVAGVVAEVKVSKGSSVQKGSVAAVIYPAGEMQIEASISEANLGDIAVGMPVTVELDWNEDKDVSYTGTIKSISAVGTSGSSGTTYAVIVEFTGDADTRYGMTAVISTLDNEAEATEEAEEAEATEETAEEEAEGEGMAPVFGNAPEMTEKGERPSMPDGMGQSSGAPSKPAE